MMIIFLQYGTEVITIPHYAGQTDGLSGQARGARPHANEGGARDWHRDQPLRAHRKRRVRSDA